MRAHQPLYALDIAIQRHPQAAVNYLLRAEYWAHTGNLALARQDCATALHLAQQTLETSDWAYAAQSYRDRALALRQWIEQYSPTGLPEIALTESDGR
ncbi:MAG: hypothetical protein HC915_20975 [Anaerolineae bacterium]|nr:hypothetical protein [Anaerolineae bacterium]